MDTNWLYNVYDKKAALQLIEFLPARIFDIHAHIYRIADLNLSGNSIFKNGPSHVSIDVWSKQLTKFLGKKKLKGGLFFPTPASNLNLKNANNYLLSQIKEG